MQTERRKHRRLSIRLPISYSVVEDDVSAADSTETINISTGGAYFGTDRKDIYTGTMLDMELTIPPGQGHFPYEGRISSRGVVVRVDELNEGPNRFGVATQFRESPRFMF